MKYKYCLEHTKEPLFIRFKVPDEVKSEIENTIENLDKTRSMNHRLAGHLAEQYECDPTEKLSELMRALSQTFVDKADWESWKFADDVYLENDLPFALKSYWINYSKKGDYQPTHNHTGAFSFVIWTKIPYDLQEELDVYKSNGNVGAQFAFQHLDAKGRIRQRAVDAIEWTGCLFPSWLMHVVYPFQTTDEYRISLSGNVFLDGTA